ncbi:hypothetical protein [uncultured Sphingobium sp.]|uniref:hypothetical protein n=1 Tax=uncultured Sphingobium sp. TaxID=316087 RepID=UPI00259B2934|nr:hypothetical protein [uncultured Sphingobium sp.]
MTRINRCTCGRVPIIRARDTRDGTVITNAACPRLECNAQGPSVEDFERNDIAATDLWNRRGGRKVA